MPKRGQPISAEQKARHARTVAGPLRAIVGCDAGEYWREMLECGHLGNIALSPQDVEWKIERGMRRHCTACLEEAQRPS
jgi:hypothetical protein